MFHPAVHILLAVGIFACPLVCRGGGRCCGDERAALEHICCDACGANPADHDRGDKRGPTSNDGCQCICGGAVIEITTLHLYLDVCEWIAPSVPLQVLATTIEPQFEFVGTLPLPDDDMNPGRALRCRLMSYLC